jgi:hypothetical protein
MKIKFKWEEIENNDYEQDSSRQLTHRAKVIGGWIIRHETKTDYKYMDDSVDGVDVEGYQTITNDLIFISDPNHEWEI